ncbi:MAG: hypothetical protein ACYS47_06640 [Planctomycetota bacterium]|jgi:hypothetical protein
MAIEGVCENCGEAYKKNVKFLGKEVKCKACDHEFLLRRSGDAEDGEEEEEEDVASGGASMEEIWNTVRNALPENVRVPVLDVGLWIALPYVILGIANGVGTALLMMFFGSEKEAGVILLAMMVMMSTVFMYSVSSVLAILATAMVAPRAKTMLQSGITAAVSAATGMIAMFIIYGVISLISGFLFLPKDDSPDYGGGGGSPFDGGGTELGMLIKILIVTFFPVVFSAFTTGALFWKPKKEA